MLHTMIINFLIDVGYFVDIQYTSTVHIDDKHMYLNPHNLINIYLKFMTVPADRVVIAIAFYLFIVLMSKFLLSVLKILYVV